MRIIAIMVPLLLLTGCAPPRPLGLATTPEQSRALLTASLDAWVQGRSQTALTRQSPAVYFNDDLFGLGWKLLAYRLADEPKVVGTGLSYIVTLTVQNGDKAPVNRRLAYRVVTEPNHCITREDGMP